MKLSISNLGKVNNSELEINNLTILVGDNNSGKTYITYSLYGLLKNWTDFINYGSLKGIETKLKTDGSISLQKDEIAKLLPECILSESPSFKKRIRDLFNDKEKIFADANVTLDIDKPKSFKDCKKQLQFGDHIILDGKVENEVLSIIYMKPIDNEIDDRLFSRIVGDTFASLVLDDIFPDPTIITAERLGISLFYKELDEKRNSLVDGLQKLDDNEGGIHPFDLLMSMSAYYATPIRDHISFTRNLDNIKKQTSKIDPSYPMEIIKDILGAEFRKETKQDIRFYTKGKKSNKFDIPLYLASSSTRCIVDIYFYLKHLAKEGDLLIIDEPESHLTLKNQRLMAKLITSIINLNIKVFITTHSDFLVKELNNLILLSNTFKEKEQWLKKNKKYYSDKDVIAFNNVSVYQSIEGELHKLNVTSKGIEIPFFDEEIGRLFSIASDLDYFID